ncbi:MAG TPA: oligoendopeptidase F, partial [Sunxiuqinia sp.]|nr:oligoendopeptidase F [Sunxiuqinia sp.]
MKKLSLKTNIVLMTFVMVLASLNGYSQKLREDIADKYKWNVTDIYKTDAAWRTDLDDLKAKVSQVDQFKGTLTQSASNLLKSLQFSSNINKQANKLYLYASMRSDLDTRAMKYNGMKQEMQQLFSEYGAKSAFIKPEILKADWSTIEGFIKEEPKLEVYRHDLDDLFRTKSHSLSEPEERIMALSSTVTSVPEDTYGTFAYGEMPKPEVTLTDGKKVAIGSAEYSFYRSAPNRQDREIVFNAYWNNYAKFKGTYGELLNGQVKGDIFRAKARHYNSALEASLNPNNIPVEVYHNLVDNVNKNLPTFYRYLKLKKRMMGVDTLKYLDLYAPAVKNVELKYTYDEATKLVEDALKPLGTDYEGTVEKAINNRWIDVYPTEGKRSGGYSNGAFYDGHPFILLNYTGLYDDVSTLAHELGHTMQSYYSNKKQPYPTASYVTFVAEVASTFNEVLLFDYMIKHVKDDNVKLSLLMNWLDRFKGTLFRQCQFAEFEMKIHEAGEEGKPLTGDSFSKMYDQIVKKYYGHDQGICYVNDYIDMEWAYIPHFYYNFYVYQYSTSFTASITLAEKVMSGN